MRVYIDDNNTSEVNTENTNEQKLNQLLYETADLTNEHHTIKIEVGSTGAVGINGFYYLDNNEQGILEMSQESYSVNKGNSVVIEVVRVGGSKGDIGCTFFTSDLNGVDGVHYSGIRESINMIEGETSKHVTVDTISYSSDIKIDYNFKCELESSGPLSTVGFVNSTTVVVVDVFVAPEGLDFISCDDATTTGTWKKASGETNKWTKENGATMPFRFTGSKVWIIGTVTSDHGSFTFSIDGDESVIVNTNRAVRKLSTLLHITNQFLLIRPKRSILYSKSK